ncbi:MAG: cation:dicarboxylate symporter family transporter, partial [Gemmatimonadales bacterium]
MTSVVSSAAAPLPPPPRTGFRRITMTQWIVISMVLGVLVGWLFPDVPGGKGFQASDLEVLSTVFLRMIKSLIVPLLFATLVVGIAGHGDDMKRVGKLALRSILYFEAVTTVALVVGLRAVAGECSAAPSAPERVACTVTPWAASTPTPVRTPAATGSSAPPAA